VVVVSLAQHVRRVLVDVLTRNDGQPRGTGLGLYIVDQLARANEAAIAYQPNQPHGSRFTIRMPRADAERPTRSRQPATIH
jgi:signal transduction histidine kinase